MQLNKHIVIVTPGFPADENDSATLTFLQEFLLAVKQLNTGVKFTIVSIQYPYKKQNYSWNGFDVISMGGAAAKFPKRFYIWLRTFFTLIKLNRKTKIDFVQTLWLTEATLVGGLYAKCFNKKLFTYAIGQDCKTDNRYLSFIKILNPEIISMSDFLKHQLAKQNIRSKIIIHQGINENKIPIISKSKKNIDLIAIGSLSTLKNHKDFIEIFATLKKENKNLKAVIIGSGPEKENLLSQIKDLNLNGIEILENISHKEIFNFLLQGKILVHTSVYEGQSTVIMEALAMGLHTVCYNIGHIPDKKIFVCENVEMMTDKIRSLLNTELDQTPFIQQTNIEMAQKFLDLYNE